jgi:hypothetical protein
MTSIQVTTLCSQLMQHNITFFFFWKKCDVENTFVILTVALQMSFQRITFSVIHIEKVTWMTHFFTLE